MLIPIVLILVLVAVLAILIPDRNKSKQTTVSTQPPKEPEPVVNVKQAAKTKNIPVGARLEKLTTMRDKGELTKAEFEEQKKRLLK